MRTEKIFRQNCSRQCKITTLLLNACWDPVYFILGNTNIGGQVEAKSASTSLNYLYI